MISDRRAQILKMLSEGKRDKQIADELHLSQNSIRVNIKRAVEEIGAKTRCHAVALFLKSQTWDD